MGFTFNEKPKIKINDRLYECDITNRDMVEGISRDWPEVARLLNESDSYSKIAIKAQREYEALVRQSDRKEMAAQKTAEYETTSREMFEKIDKALAASKRFIIGSLGEDEYNEIFAGRKVNLAEHVAVATYIFNWANSERQRFLSKYFDKDGNPKEEVVETNATHKPSNYYKRKKRKH